MSPESAARVARWWTRIYTAGLPRDQRIRRRLEIESDIFESLAEREASQQILSRLIRGACDDVIWSTGQMERTARETFWWTVGSLLVLSAVVVWFAFTPDGAGMRNSIWAWPFMLILHNLGFVAFIGLRTAVDLRLTTRVFGTVPVSDLTRKLMPATGGAAAVVIATGLALFLPDPGALLGNEMFRIKLAVLAVALLNMWFLHAVTFRTVGEWDADRSAPLAARISGILSLTCWATIIVAALIAPFVPGWD